MNQWYSGPKVDYLEENGNGYSKRLKKKKDHKKTSRKKSSSEENKKHKTLFDYSN